MLGRRNPVGADFSPPSCSDSVYVWGRGGGDQSRPLRPLREDRSTMSKYVFLLEREKVRYNSLHACGRRQVVRPKLPNQFHARFFRKLTKQTITKNQFKGVLFDTPLFFPSVRETGETRVFDELLTNVRILDPAGPCNRGFVCVRFVAASSLPALRTIGDRL